MAVSSVHNKAIEERIAQHTSLVELFHLLDRAIDGIDGVESEEGVEGLRQFWNPREIERARQVIDAVKGGSSALRA